MAEQTATVTVDRKIAFPFVNHCRSQGFPAKRVLESLMVKFLQDQGVKIPSEDELPPLMKKRVPMKV